MCGRFAFIASYETLKVHYALANSVDITPRFNIAPGADVLCLVKTSSDELQAVVLHWGLIPSWAMDKKKIGSLINARAETLFEKPAFRGAMKTRRCLMPMSGFFEWRIENGMKQPYFFHKTNEVVFCVAALWETWQSGDEVIHSCCLITVDANSFMEPIHHRMPAILDEKAQALWLDNSQSPREELMALLKPYPYDDLETYRVTPLMNKADFDNPLALKAFIK